MALSEMPPITRLDLALVELPEGHPAAELDRWVPVHGFLIEHPDGAIVVDTGVGFGNAGIDDAYRPRRVELTSLLRDRAIEPDDVVAVVNSHLHFDHCGQNPMLFGSSTCFYAQAAEFELVENDPSYTDATWALCPDSQRRTIQGDDEIADGVTVLATPGHTAGHQSVLVEADDRRVIIGAQVVWHADELAAETASPANVDPIPELQAAAVESIRRITSLRPEVIHLSHCPAHHPS